MYNGKTIEAATQIDIKVHKAITKRTYVTSLVIFIIGLAGFIGSFIPYMMLDDIDYLLIVVEVCVVLAIIGGMMVMRLRSAYRNTASQGSALQTFSFHKDGVVVTVLFPGAAQTPYPKIYYRHAKKARLCGKKKEYLVFNNGRMMYPVYLASLTEMEKYTLLSLFGKKDKWIRKRVKYAGPALKLEGGQAYRAVSADDIFDMNQPPEDDVFDLGSGKKDTQAAKKTEKAPEAKPAAKPVENPAAKPAGNPAEKEDDFFKDHYWDSPAGGEDDPFDFDAPEGLGQNDAGKSADGESGDDRKE